MEPPILAWSHGQRGPADGRSVDSGEVRA
jgi:hypothetical protein